MGYRDSTSVVIFCYPWNSGGKFLINCAGLSDECYLQDLQLVKKQRANELTPLDKFVLLNRELDLINEEWHDGAQRDVRYGLKTKPEVLHAESNAVAKLAKSTNSGEGADLFVTTAPCLDCAKLIHQAGIKRVWFGEDYRDNAGLTFLEKSGIIVEQVK
mgnify:CR=1 FL=1